MREIDQVTDKKAREILNERAKDSCRRQMIRKLNYKLCVNFNYDKKNSPHA